MSLKELDAVFSRLPGGWEINASLPDDFLHIWKERLSPVEKKDVGVNWMEFTADLSEIRLRGTDESHCLLVSGSPRQAEAALRNFLTRVNAGGRLLFVLPVSAAATAVAQSAADWASAFVLVDLNALIGVLGADNWKAILSGFIRRALPLRALIAFDIALSAQGSMFYGRGDELDRLRDEVKVNFAIAGPGKIGKTSLVKQYHNNLKRKKKASTTFYVDFYELTDRSATHWPRHLAMKVDANSMSDRVTLADFPNFIRRLRTKLDGQPPTLILDEMDEIVSQGENIKQLLASIEKQELCRYIFCGRGELYKAARNSATGLGGRFRLMRLEPLDDQAARRLFLEPLEALGISIENREKTVDFVLRLTGRLPQLIQFYGQNLAEIAAKAQIGTINQEHIDKLNSDFETAQYFTSPLEDLSSPETKLIAYALLQTEHSHVTPAVLQSLTGRNRVEFSIEDLKRICDELVIMNVLTWTADSYQLANQALRHYSRQFGYLDKALSRAREQVWKKRGVSPTVTH